MKNSRWRMSPIALVSATALLVAGASMSANHLLGKRASTVDPQVTTENGESAREKAIREQEVRRRVVVTVMDGEVARTADRLGEVEALALAASLYAATAQLRGRAPRTTGDLLAGVTAANLLPPGVSLTQTEGALASSHGHLFVRYRPAPLAIEVVAVGREPGDGPAILVRVPDDTNSAGGASLFMATRIRDVNIPAAFAPATEVISAGWSPEPLRSLK